MLFHHRLDSRDWFLLPLTGTLKSRYLMYVECVFYVVKFVVTMPCACMHIMMQVIWKYFYSYRSVGDHGTLYQLRNKLNRTNVVSVPKKDMNACEDFITTVTSGLVVAAALNTFELESVNDCPADHIVLDAESVWTLMVRGESV